MSMETGSAATSQGNYIVGDFESGNKQHFHKSKTQYQAIGRSSNATDRQNYSIEESKGNNGGNSFRGKH